MAAIPLSAFSCRRPASCTGPGTGHDVVSALSVRRLGCQTGDWREAGRAEAVLDLDQRLAVGRAKFRRGRGFVGRLQATDLGHDAQPRLDVSLRPPPPGLVVVVVCD